MDNDNFDTIYSIIYYIESMPVSVRKEIIENLNRGLKDLLKELQKSKLLN